ncbi:phage tail protein [Simplicispira psychrophila]|uniref:phage tail protein n=1 Tax=Simplicispira psychrophila TaxID=80882 RepID=UPI00047F2216|nr:tail fiber protein [Simplicispira psychrophila]
MADPFTGEIRAFAFDYAPQDWAFCTGQSITVQQNPALYAVIGNRYGGTTNQNFKLPNLMGHAPMGQGSGPGLTPRTVGQATGTATVTLTTAQLPPHRHTIAVLVGKATADTPTDNFLAVGNKPAGFGTVPQPTYAPGPLTAPLDTPLAPTALTPFPGGGQPHSNLQPYLALNLCICLNGEFPVRP